MEEFEKFYSKKTVPKAKDIVTSYRIGGSFLDDIVLKLMGIRNDVNRKIFGEDLSWISDLDDRSHMQTAIENFYKEVRYEHASRSTSDEGVRECVRRVIYEIKGREEVAAYKGMVFEKQDIEGFTPVILAGGRASRFNMLPKSLMFVKGKNLLERSIEHLHKIGFKDSKMYVITSLGSDDETSEPYWYLRNHFPEINAFQVDWSGPAKFEERGYPRRAPDYSKALLLKDIVEGEIYAGNERKKHEFGGHSFKKTKVSKHVLALYADVLLFSETPIKIAMKNMIEGSNTGGLEVDMVEDSYSDYDSIKFDIPINVFNSEAVRKIGKIPSDYELGFGYLHDKIAKLGYEKNKVRSYQKFSNLNDIKTYRMLYGCIPCTGATEELLE